MDIVGPSPRGWGGAHYILVALFTPELDAIAFQLQCFHIRATRLCVKVLSNCFLDFVTFSSALFSAFLWLLNFMLLQGLTGKLASKLQAGPQLT
ncbi:hypothetical protein SRHO_G00240480 [Serrasalmus rhombeus]